MIHHSKHTPTAGWPRAVLVSQAGISMLETVFALGALAVALLGILAANVVSDQLQVSSDYTEIGNNLLEDKMEEIRGTPFEQAWSIYDGQVETASGLPGGTVTTTLLSESEAAGALGYSVDLDLDGVTDETSAANPNMRILAVRVQVEWTDQMGQQILEQETLVFPVEVRDDL